jgi:hypothetical protein
VFTQTRKSTVSWTSPPLTPIVLWFTLISSYNLSQDISRGLDLLDFHIKIKHESFRSQTPPIYMLSNQGDRSSAMQQGKHGLEYFTVRPAAWPRIQHSFGKGKLIHFRITVLQNESKQIIAKRYAFQ